MTSARPFYVAGRPETGPAALDVINPFTGELLASVSVPSAEQTEQAAAARLPLSVRADALMHVSRRLAERQEEVAALITAENGKPVKWAMAEAGRAVSVFRFAAEETRRFNGDVQRLDTDAGGAGRLAYVKRVPKGPVLGIAPFNFPLNLVAHKVAPAIAVGAPILIKPAPATPLSSLLLGELLAETDLPAGMWSVLPVPNDAMPGLVADPRLPVISFTGSTTVGYAIADAVPRKHLTLELGGNAAAVVCADFGDGADLAWAAARIATFANYQAGQSCISVQRVLVDAGLIERFTPLLLEQVAALGTGDPADPATDVGPMVNEAAAVRVEQWVDEAVASGARLLAGGTRDGATYAPTVLTDVPLDAKISCEEVFGPVMVLQPVSGVDEAFDVVNDSRFGLQAGVFTRDLRTAFRAHAELQVGGVVIGDVPSYRADQMPYGGVKESGVGREGLKYAMEDFTDIRVMVLTGLEL
jgi:aldehyde dehydrogenase (NAD+)